MTALFPAYKYSGFNPISADRWHNVLEPLSVCLPSDPVIFADVPTDQLARPSWMENPAVQRYGQLTQAGRKRFKGPLLVLAGKVDAAVSLESVVSAFNDTCAINTRNDWSQSLEMVTYRSLSCHPGFADAVVGLDQSRAFRKTGSQARL